MKVKFLPQDIEHEIGPDQSIMQLAHEKGIKIKSVCNGMPSCAECRVKVVEGEHNLFPPSVKELSLIGTGYYIDQRRLSCQLKCFGDVTVDLSEQEHKEHTAMQRRPQGNLRKDDSEVSHAVTGNLIEDQQDEFKEVLEAEPQHKRPSRNRNRSRNRHRSGGDKRGGGGDNKRSGGGNRNRRHKNRGSKNKNSNN